MKNKLIKALVKVVSIEGDILRFQSYAEEGIAYRLSRGEVEKATSIKWKNMDDQIVRFSDLVKAAFGLLGVTEETASARGSEFRSQPVEEVIVEIEESTVDENPSEFLFSKLLPDQLTVDAGELGGDPRCQEADRGHFRGHRKCGQSSPVARQTVLLLAASNRLEKPRDTPYSGQTCRTVRRGMRPSTPLLSSRGVKKGYSLIEGGLFFLV